MEGQSNTPENVPDIAVKVSPFTDRIREMIAKVPASDEINWSDSPLFFETIQSTNFVRSYGHARQNLARALTGLMYGSRVEDMLAVMIKKTCKVDCKAVPAFTLPTNFPIRLRFSSKCDGLSVHDATSMDTIELLTTQSWTEFIEKIASIDKAEAPYRTQAVKRRRNLNDLERTFVLTIPTETFKCNILLGYPQDARRHASSINDVIDVSEIDAYDPIGLAPLVDLTVFIYEGTKRDAARLRAVIERAVRDRHERISKMVPAYATVDYDHIRDMLEGVPEDHPAHVHLGCLVPVGPTAWTWESLSKKLTIRVLRADDENYAALLPHAIATMSRAPQSEQRYAERLQLITLVANLVPVIAYEYEIGKHSTRVWSKELATAQHQSMLAVADQVKNQYQPLRLSASLGDRIVFEKLWRSWAHNTYITTLNEKIRSLDPDLYDRFCTKTHRILFDGNLARYDVTYVRDTVGRVAMGERDKDCAACFKEIAPIKEHRQLESVTSLVKSVIENLKM